MQETHLVPIQITASLLPKPDMQRIDEHTAWPLLSRLPMRVTAGIPLRHFKVQDLLALKAGQTLSSEWKTTDDVPFRIGAVQLSWCEFEVVENRLAARLTRLA